MTREKMVSKVLEVKEIRREQVEAEVRKAREKLSAEQQKLRDFEQTYKENCIELTDRQLAGTLPVREMDVYYAYLRQIGKEIELQKTIVAAQQNEVAAREESMLEAYKEERLVELLHNKIVHQEAKEADQAEQKNMDAEFIMRKMGR